MYKIYTDSKEPQQPRERPHLQLLQDTTAFIDAHYAFKIQ